MKRRNDVGPSGVRALAYSVTNFECVFLSGLSSFNAAVLFIQVADFLAKRRDNLFLEFDISISHSVRDTFLSTGNETAYRVTN